MNSYFVQFSHYAVNNKDNIVVIAPNIQTVMEAYKNHNLYAVNDTLVVNGKLQRSDTSNSLPDWSEYLVNQAKSDNRVCVLNN